MSPGVSEGLTSVAERLVVVVVCDKGEPGGQRQDCRGSKWERRTVGYAFKARFDGRLEKNSD